jgi:hypothetical protein
MSRATDPATLRTLSENGQALAEQLDRETASLLFRQCLELPDPRKHALALLPHLQVLSRVADRAEETSIRAEIPVLLVRVLTATAQQPRDNRHPPVTELFASFVDRLTDEQMIELLRYPCCTGVWGQVVIDKLAKRHNQPARSWWELRQTPGIVRIGRR